MPKSLLGLLTLLSLSPFTVIGLVIAMFQAGYRAGDSLLDSWLDRAEEAERGKR